MHQMCKAVITLSPDENWSKCIYAAANNSVADLYSSPATVLLQNCYRRKKTVHTVLFCCNFDLEFL